jgi:hypothetical protein
MADTPKSIQPEVAARLSCLLEPYQLAELIETMEAAKSAGDGWYRVTLDCSPGRVDIEGSFTRKPRKLDLRK